ncbi:hypothetical protein E0K89_010435 [Aquicoccus sp. SCR17]|nr:hypothetical protein [Carideicomes alvinocaridis]
MTDLDWTKKTLAEVLGEDRGLPDNVAMRIDMIDKDDLDSLAPDERKAMLQAFKDGAQMARNERQPELGEGNTRPEYSVMDIEAGLRNARSALEAVPAGKRSQTANALLADCACAPAELPQT